MGRRPARQPTARPAAAAADTDTWTRTSPDAGPETHTGWDTAGWRLFYRWTIGAHLVVGHEARDVWVLTDDDAGHRDVYNGSTGSLPLCGHEPGR